MATEPPATDTVPPALRAAWAQVVQASGQSVDALHGADLYEVRRALMLLAATADHASYGLVGLGAPGPIAARAMMRLESTGGRTLCSDMISRRVAVLPKVHTPRTGMTLRSLSKNLAFVVLREVNARWLRGAPNSTHARRELNILVLPWPLEVDDECFRRIDQRDHVSQRESFFSFQPPRVHARDIVGAIGRARAALRGRGGVDAVVLPELALTEEAWVEVKAATIDNPREFPSLRTLVAGVSAGPRGGERVVCRDGSKRYTAAGRNYAAIAVRAAGDGAGASCTFEQGKHHRWCLDGRQVEQYGLTSTLAPEHDWWEWTEIEERVVTFLELEPWLVVSLLVCEDLARPDPVAEVVRAVGPNLVIALLLDGPQIQVRWPGRYATVLADDPGSAVLTVTSHGMVSRSKRLERGPKPQRESIMWRNDLECASLKLGKGKSGFLLSLTQVERLERTADGREQTDGYGTSHIRFKAQEI